LAGGVSLFTTEGLISTAAAEAYIRARPLAQLAEQANQHVRIIDQAANLHGAARGRAEVHKDSEPGSECSSTRP
jgi:hypothetical protein